MQAHDRTKGTRTDTSAPNQPTPPLYDIRVKGHLEARWAAWFDGMSLVNDSDGTTIISGPVIDQAALHGLLQKLRDIGMPLLAVTQVNPER